jgi:hypothetical protein
MDHYTRNEWTKTIEFTVGQRLTGRPRQDIYEVSAIQNYELGTRLQLDDRVFRYAKAGGTLNPDLGAKTALHQLVAIAALAAASVSGTKSVSLTVAATDGINSDGAIAANELQGGYIVIYTHAGYTIVRKIVSNTAVAAGGGTMVVTIDKPLPCALTATTMHGECIASPYLNVQTGNFPTRSVVGVPTMPATEGQYLWIQTWGPCWIAPQAEVSVGNNNRLVVFRHDGSIDEFDTTDANVAKAQIAGFVITNAADGSQGAPFIFLQIAP